MRHARRPGFKLVSVQTRGLCSHDFGRGLGGNWLGLPILCPADTFPHREAGEWGGFPHSYNQKDLVGGVLRQAATGHMAQVRAKTGNSVR